MPSRTFPGWVENSDSIDRIVDALLKHWKRASRIPNRDRLDAAVQRYLRGDRRALDDIVGMVPQTNGRKVFDVAIEKSAVSAMLDEAAAIEHTIGVATGTFDMATARATAWATQHALDLAGYLDDQQKKTISDILLRALRGEGNAVWASPLIYDTVGLTPQQAAWVIARQDEYINGGFTVAQAREFALLFADDLRLQRARTIARTEINTALAAGRTEGWLQAREEGFLIAPMKMWIVGPGACPLCQQMNGAQVELDEMFDTPFGPLDGPPAHPNCRCNTGIQTGELPVERLVGQRAMEILRAGQPMRVQKGDRPGHPFHGNQHTGGIGGGAPKPKGHSLTSRDDGDVMSVHGSQYAGTLSEDEKTLWDAQNRPIYEKRQQYARYMALRAAVDDDYAPVMDAANAWNHGNDAVPQASGPINAAAQEFAREHYNVFPVDYTAEVANPLAGSLPGARSPDKTSVDRAADRYARTLMRAVEHATPRNITLYRGARVRGIQNIHPGDRYVDGLSSFSRDKGVAGTFADIDDMYSDADQPVIIKTEGPVRSVPVSALVKPIAGLEPLYWNADEILSGGLFEVTKVERHQHATGGGWAGQPSFDLDEPVDVITVRQIEPSIAKSQDITGAISTGGFRYDLLLMHKGEAAGHIYHGNQHDGLHIFGSRQPKGTVYRAMSRSDLERVRREGTLTGSHAGEVWASNRPTDSYLDPGEVIVAIHTEHGDRIGGGFGGDVKLRELPADRIIDVYDPEFAGTNGQPDHRSIDVVGRWERGITGRYYAAERHNVEIDLPPVPAGRKRFYRRTSDSKAGWYASEPFMDDQYVGGRHLSWIDLTPEEAAKNRATAAGEAGNIFLDRNDKDLINRAHFVSMMSKGDYEGHPFRGNQYVRGIPGGTVDALVRAHPRLPGEDIFTWQGRIVNGLSDETKSDVLFALRERYRPVGYIKRGMQRWRKEHGLPEPKVDISKVRAPIEKSQKVARAFETAVDNPNDPRVREAFADFKRQNAEMFDFMTRPRSKGGLGIKVTFTDKVDPYPTAKAQADDLRRNHHITIQSGLGGHHESSMTRQEYDEFRAVHDVFGHAGIGGGFDRHGEYQAWLAHDSMYTGLGREAMSSEYHGVNTAMWTGDVGTPGTGKTVLLPADLIANPWDDLGNLVRKDDAEAREVIRALGLTTEWARWYDPQPMHLDVLAKGEHINHPFRGNQHTGGIPGVGAYLAPDTGGGGGLAVADAISLLGGEPGAPKPNVNAGDRPANHRDFLQVYESNDKDLARAIENGRERFRRGDVGGGVSDSTWYTDMLSPHQDQYLVKRSRAGSGDGGEALSELMSAQILDATDIKHMSVRRGGSMSQDGDGAIVIQHMDAQAGVERGSFEVGWGNAIAPYDDSVAQHKLLGDEIGLDLFDKITANPDRHAGNIATVRDADGDTRIAIIDNSLTMGASLYGKADRPWVNHLLNSERVGQRPASYVQSMAQQIGAPIGREEAGILYDAQISALRRGVDSLRDPGSTKNIGVNRNPKARELYNQRIKELTLAVNYYADPRSRERYLDAMYAPDPRRVREAGPPIGAKLGSPRPIGKPIGRTEKRARRAALREKVDASIQAGHHAHALAEAERVMRAAQDRARAVNARVEAGEASQAELDAAIEAFHIANGKYLDVQMAGR